MLMWKQIFNKLTLIDSLNGPQKNKSSFEMDKCSHIALGNSQKLLRFGKDVIKSASVQSYHGLSFPSDFKSIRAKLNLYKSMMVPVIMFPSPFYNLSNYFVGELENIQKRVVKWIDSEEKVPK